MNRINQLFKERQTNILSIYFTAGHPRIGTTARILESLQANGAHMVEIGIPFSDPIADGSVIQNSSQMAIKNGMTLPLLLEELKDIRKRVSIPLVLMGYFNNVLQYGVEKLCAQMQTIGLDGIILPDMPPDYYQEHYQTVFQKYEIVPVFLITPQTPDKRIIQIDHLSRGFIYMVSSATTTGSSLKSAPNKGEYFKRVKSMKLNNPRVIGFGISSREEFQHACKYANGAIVGSKFVKALDSCHNVDNCVEEFMQGFL